MYHPEKSPVQFTEGAAIAATSGADQFPQFAALVRDDMLLSSYRCIDSNRSQSPGRQSLSPSQ